jgi:hypothetical protein
MRKIVERFAIILILELILMTTTFSINAAMRSSTS